MDTEEQILKVLSGGSLADILERIRFGEIIIKVKDGKIAYLEVTRKVKIMG